MQSYFLVFVSVVLFTILKFLVEEIVRYIISCCCGYSKQTTSLNGNLESGAELTNVTVTPMGGNPTVIIDSSKEAPVKSITKQIEATSQSIVFLLFQALSSLFSIISAFENIDSTQSTWTKYQNFYGLLVNSSVLTFIYSMFALCEFAQFDSHPLARNIVYGCWWSLLLFMIPCIVTHIIPGLILYCWVVVLYIVICFVLRAILSRIIDILTDKKWLSIQDNEVILRVFGVNFVLRLFFMLIFQTVYAYAYFAYQVHSSKGAMDASAYLSVISDEYSLRTQTLCTYQHAMESVESFVVFFNWI